MPSTKTPSTPTLDPTDEVVIAPGGPRLKSTTTLVEPGQCVHELLLDVAGHRHRKAIHVDFRCVHAFRLEENLVPLLVREPDDLVFERRAVARPDPLNLPIE